MTKLEQLALFLRFWFSPWGAAKGEIWESFSKDLPFTDASAEKICGHIMDGDGSWFKWDELESYREK